MYIDNKHDTITTGDTAKTTLRINLEGKRSESVSISCSGMPSSQGRCFVDGLSGSVIVTPSDSVVISVETGSSTVAKTYSIRITGTSGDITRHEDFVLVVNEKQKEKSPVERPKGQTVTPDLNRDAPIGSVTVEHQAYLIKYRGSAMVQVCGEIENYQKGDPIHVTVKNPRGDSVMDMSLISKDGKFHMPLMIDWSYTEGTYTVEISSRGNAVGYATFDVVKDNHEDIQTTSKFNIIIKKLQVTDSIFSPGDTVNVKIIVKNQDTENRSSMRVEIKGPDVKTKQFIKNIIFQKDLLTLRQGEEKTIHVSWKIPRDATGGTFVILAHIYDSKENIYSQKFEYIEVDAGTSYIELGSYDKKAIVHVHLSNNVRSYILDNYKTELEICGVNNLIYICEGELLNFQKKVPKLNSGDYKPLIEAIANTNPNLNLKGTDFSVVYFKDGRLEFYPYSLKELYDNVVFYKITNEITHFISSWQEILFSFGMEVYDNIPKAPSNLDIPESYYSIIPENKILQEKVVQTVIDNHDVKRDMEKRLSISSWFKTTASWWTEGIVSDKEFLNGIE